MVARKTRTRMGAPGTKPALYKEETRVKLSTTVARATYDFLQSLVDSGAASSIAEAVDQSIDLVRRWDNRRRLAQATAHYYEQLSPEAMAEEDALGRDIAAAAREIDFDKEL